MRQTSSRHVISGAFVFLLLAVFAVCSTVLVLFGAQTYRAIVQKSEAHSDSRILTNFLRNTIRGNDGAGVIGTEESGDMSVLTVRYEYDGEPYVTYVYCCEGELRELFTGGDREFDPTEGERIADAQAFTAEIQGTVLTMHVTDTTGETTQLHMALRSSEKEAAAQ